MSGLIRGAQLEGETFPLPGREPGPRAADKVDNGKATTDTPVAHDVSSAGEAGDAGEWMETEGKEYADPSPEVRKDAMLEADIAERERTLRERLDAEAEQLRERAREDGYRQGMEEGKREAREELQKAIEQVQAVIRSADAANRETIDGLEDYAVEIVFEAVTKILGEQLVHRDGVVAVVREVLQRAKDKVGMVAHVSPEDYRLLTENGSEGVFDGVEGEEVELKPDERVELGGCLLVTSSGNLDGRLEIQLQQLKETLMLVRGRPTGIGSE